MLYHKFPILRLLIPFIAGIMLAIQFHLPLHVSLIATLACFILLLILYFLMGKNYQDPLKWPLGIAITIMFLLLGCLLMSIQAIKNGPSYLPASGKSYDCTAVIIEDPTEKPNSFKTILKVESCKCDDQFFNIEAKVLTYLAKDSLSKKLKYGDKLVFSGQFSSIDSPKNPGQFNYKKYLANNYIYYQVYLKDWQWKKSGTIEGFSLKRWASRTRNHFLDIFKANGLTGNEYKVASALILGQSDNLDSETLQEYSGSGVIHILSVSGLHVGVIFMVLNLFLSFMDKNKSSLLLKTLILLFVIWSYSLITGFAPAVCRAAAMLSFISVGKLLNRKVHPINTISVSAFVVILLDPIVITNIGFQLSYIAVAGIILMYDGLNRLWYSRFRVVELVWQMIAICLAAQIATAPLSVYYFHQFPVYFLPANLLAIPLSSLAIYSGLITIATSFLHPLSSLFGWITSFLVKALNWSVAFIESLPGAVWPGIHLSFIEMILLYAILTSILLYLSTKNTKLIIGSLCLLLIFIADRTVIALETRLQKRIIVYSIRNNCAVGFLNRNYELLVADSSVFYDQRMSDFNIKNSLVEYGIRKCYHINSDILFKQSIHLDFPLCDIRTTGNAITFFDKKMIVIHKELPGISLDRKIKCHLLLVTHNPKITILEIIRVFDPQFIVFDESNPEWQVKKWLSECEELEIDGYSTHDKGAFIWQVE